MSHGIDFVFDQIRDERERQDNKWGSQRKHSNEKWLAILAEEFGEAATEVNDRLDSALFEELVQVAAVAVCWLEALVDQAEARIELAEPIAAEHIAAAHMAARNGRVD